MNVSLGDSMPPNGPDHQMVFYSMIGAPRFIFAPIPWRLGTTPLYAESHARVATTSASTPVRNVGCMTGANFGL